MKELLNCSLKFETWRSHNDNLIWLSINTEKWILKWLQDDDQDNEMDSWSTATLESAKPVFEEVYRTKVQSELTAMYYVIQQILTNFRRRE